MDQVRDPQAMRGWLATIGRRICRRMKQREALAPVIALADDAIGEYAEPEEAMEQARLSGCVSAALEGLPPAYRAAYRLRDIENLSTEEAAVRLGIGERNLKSRLHRARAMIRKSFDAGICGDIPRKL